MKAIVKGSLVIAGYVLAFLIAIGVVSLYVAHTNGPDRQTYGAMYAFGDSLLFLAVFGVVASAPTGAALFFLRPYRAFWRVLPVVVSGIVATSLAACVIYTIARTAPPPVHIWAAAAVLRILMAPLVALTLLLSGLFSPSRHLRIGLLFAAAIEAAVFAFYVAFLWRH